MDLKIYTGVSVSELFGYRDPPFSYLLSELFGYQDKGRGSLYPNRGPVIQTRVKKLSDRKLIEGLDCLSMES